MAQIKQTTHQSDNHSSKLGSSQSNTDLQNNTLDKANNLDASDINTHKQSNLADNLTSGSIIDSMIDTAAATAISNPPPDTGSLDAVFALLSQTFHGLTQLPYFEFVQTLYQLPTYTVFHISGHHLYVNPFDKTVVASRIERILDHFMIGQNLRQCITSRQTLDETSFEQQTQRHLQAGDKKLTLSKLIWYIGLEMLPRNTFEDHHHLAIEARFMPNLAGINFVPNYVLPLISSCIGRVRTLQEFQQLFPQLTNAQINQVIILLALSHGLNNAVLLNSRPAITFGSHYQQPTVTASTTAPNPLSGNTVTNNTGIQKAQKTGFLKRLLGRLGVNV